MSFPCWSFSASQQQHLNATCDLLPSPASACLHLFEQFIGQQMVHLQDSISKRLHHHTFYNMLSNKIFEAHCVQILSCSSLGMNVWFIIWPIFPTFQFFSQCFKHDLNYHILQLQASFDVCAHIPLTLWVSTSYVVPMAMSTWGPLLPLHEMLVFMWDENNYMCFP